MFFFFLLLLVVCIGVSFKLKRKIMNKCCQFMLFLLLLLCYLVGEIFDFRQHLIDISYPYCFSMVVDKTIGAKFETSSIHFASIKYYTCDKEVFYILNLKCIRSNQTLKRNISQQNIYIYIYSYLCRIINRLFGTLFVAPSTWRTHKPNFYTVRK